MILCPSCGGENGDTVKFCVKCGASVAGMPPQPGSWQQPSAGVYDAPPGGSQYGSSYGSQYGNYTPPSPNDYPTYNPPAVPQYQQPVSPNYWQEVGADKKVAAGICGILLGGLGVHKFILGYTTEGVIMLLITLLTCGFGAIVTGTIGLIEGIIYLVKTDEDFVRTYIHNRRGWF